MGFRNILCLVLLLSAFCVRGEEETKEGKDGGKEMDWAEMLQMGMAIGKSVLGEEAIEQLKKGDLSKLIEVGSKVFGEDTIKDFLNSATEGAFDTKQERNTENDLPDDIDDEIELDEPVVTEVDQEMNTTESTDADPVEVRHLEIDNKFKNSII